MGYLFIYVVEVIFYMGVRLIIVFDWGVNNLVFSFVFFLKVSVTCVGVVSR